MQSRLLLHFEPRLLPTNFTWLKIVTLLISPFKSSAEWGGLCPEPGQPALSLLDNPICLSTGAQPVSSSHPRGSAFSWV